MKPRFHTLADAAHTLRAFSRDQRAAVLEASLVLPAAELGLRLVGLRRTWDVLCAGAPGSREDVPAAQAIGRAVQGAARWSPARPRCLARSLVLCRLLRRRGIAGVLRIGVASPGRDFEAHAWVEVAGQPVGDSIAGVERFTAFEHPAP